MCVCGRLTCMVIDTSRLSSIVSMGSMAAAGRQSRLEGRDGCRSCVALRPRSRVAVAPSVRAVARCCLRVRLTGREGAEEGEESRGSRTPAVGETKGQQRVAEGGRGALRAEGRRRGGAAEQTRVTKQQQRAIVNALTCCAHPILSSLVNVRSLMTPKAIRAEGRDRVSTPESSHSADSLPWSDPLVRC